MKKFRIPAAITACLVFALALLGINYTINAERADQASEAKSSIGSVGKRACGTVHNTEKISADEADFSVLPLIKETEISPSKKR